VLLEQRRLYLVHKVSKELLGLEEQTERLVLQVEMDQMEQQVHRELLDQSVQLVHKD
jgi:hypothetical protein